MAALREMLDVAKAHGVNVIIYNVPLRWDIEPPYELEAYRDWKRQAGEMIRAAGVTFLDLDELVPNDQWGLHHGDKVDFMHFQVTGHRLLGKRIADEVKEKVASR